MISTYRIQSNGDVYRIDFRKRWPWSHYEMYCISHPDCPYPLGFQAHLDKGDQMSVALGREPKTLERAKAVALCWMSGFSHHARTGDFSDGSVRINVAES